jgi:hypothetical protein
MYELFLRVIIETMVDDLRYVGSVHVSLDNTWESTFRTGANITTQFTHVKILNFSYAGPFPINPPQLLLIKSSTLAPYEDQMMVDSTLPFRKINVIGSVQWLGGSYAVINNTLAPRMVGRNALSMPLSNGLLNIEITNADQTVPAIAAPQKVYLEIGLFTQCFN